MAKLNRLRKEKHNRDVNAKAALQSKMMKKLKNSFTSKEKKMTEKEMKASMFTTSDKGKLLQRKEPKGDQLAQIQIDETKSNVREPAKREMNIRTKFAMGITKILRRYMTGGSFADESKEDRLKRT